VGISAWDREVLDLIATLKGELTQLYDEGASLTDPQLLEYSRRIDHLIVDWCREHDSAELG